jgi:hypothetical protein
VTRFFAIALLLSFAVTAQKQEEAPAKPISAAEKARLSNLLPAGTAGPAEFYSSNLYQYIDGGAEAYHKFHMTAMVHREYKVKGVEMTVDIYDMGSPSNASGIYASERSPDYHFLPIGAEGYASEHTLNFLQGRFYVKLAAFGDKDPVAKMLHTFAETISAKIGGSKQRSGAADERR